MKTLALVVLVCLAPSFLFAQNTGTGVKPFGSYTQGGFDTINNQDLNVTLAIPIVSSAGRGLPLALNLIYNSQIYSISGGVLFPVSNFGWKWDMPPGGTSTNDTSSSDQVKCLKAGWPLWVTNTYYTNFRFIDALGVVHFFPNITWTEMGCGDTWSGTGSGHASDASGYYMTSSLGVIQSVKGPGGLQYPNSNTAVDTNGNFISRNVISSTETDWTDSVGNVALKILYTPNNTSPTQIQYQFQDTTGAYQTMKLTLQTLNIATNFGCSNGVSEYSGMATVPEELDIPSPNGPSVFLKYNFYYEQTTTGNYSGRLQKISLPTGGTYEYDYPAPNDGINCSDGSDLSMNRTVNDANFNSATWNFVRNATNKTTTVTTPQMSDTSNANNTVYTFNSTGREVTRKIYADTGSMNLLRTINSSWAGNNTPSSSITILEDGTTKAETDTSYDSNGLLDSVTEYDWGSGTHGSSSPIRTTTYTYQTSSGYTSRNIINLVTSKQIKDGTGTIQYRQDTAYDGAALTCPVSALQHDDADYPCTMTTRGDPTSVTTYLTPATPTGPITRNFTYDWFGNLLTAQLSCCNTKTWTYTSAYQYSQPTIVQSGTSPSLSTTYTYNQYTGLVTKAVDPNGFETDYSYDFLRRPLTVLQKNGSTTGQSVSYSYSDSAPFGSTVSTTIDSSNSVQNISVVDGLGRTLTTTTKNASGTSFSIVEHEYDPAGVAYGVSNPHAPGGTVFWNSTTHNLLGRMTTVTLPDASRTTYVSIANTVLATDPTNKQLESTYDAAGRLTVVTEPDVNNGNSLTKTTTYTYTVLDALQSVTNPDQVRTYNYDKVGQLLSTITPEAGTTCFASKTGSTCGTDGYDSFDNLLLKRTDARGVLTSYTYDGLNRLTGASYNVGTTGVPATSSVSLTYGLDSSCASAHGAGCIGQVITMTDGVGSENYTYNSLEQMTQLKKVIGGTTYTTNYQYNIAGELTQITYPSGRVIQQSIDSIGRLCEIAPSTTGCGTAASPYATGYLYNAANQVTQLKYGNGLYGSLGYSANRLQLSCLDYSNQNRSGTCTHDTNTKFGLDYTYGSAAANNGQITKISDYVDGGRTTAYTYDGLARLSTAQTNGSTAYPAWSLAWGYDPYGNRLKQTLVSGPGYPGSVMVAASTNQITCINGTNPNCSGGVVPTYDANGNMTYEGTNTMVYDAENRAVSATNQSASGNYTYDGNGLRVKKVSGGTTTVYIFSGSKVIAEYNNGAAPSSPTKEYVYAGSQLVANVVGGTTTYFQYDHLSVRLLSDVNGNLTGQRGEYPFGDIWYESGVITKWKFTTYERDSESDNDYGQARFYRWLIGRFLSPDPLSGSTADPQSLNRYTYTENNPISLMDPSGMMETIACGDLDDDGSCGADMGGGGGVGVNPGCLAACGATLPGYVTSSMGNPNLSNMLGRDSFMFDTEGDKVYYNPGLDDWFSSFPSGDIPGGVLSRLGGGGGRDAKSALAQYMRATLHDRLSNDPDCLSFLSGRGGNPLQTLRTIPISLGAVEGGGSAQTTWTDNRPYSLEPSSPSITIDPNGYFFQQGARTTNGYLTGTPRYQAADLLHELGHATGVLPNEKGPNYFDAEATNNTVIGTNCAKTLSSFQNVPLVGPIPQ